MVLSLVGTVLESDHFTAHMCKFSSLISDPKMDKKTLSTLYYELVHFKF